LQCVDKLISKKANIPLLTLGIAVVPDRYGLSMRSRSYADGRGLTKDATGELQPETYGGTLIVRYARRTLIGCLVIVLGTFAARPSDAGGGCCDRCGSEGSQKVCRLKCTYKEVKITCWTSKCEDFCVPGPCPLPCGHGCLPASCDACAGACDGGCTGAGAPRHARIRTKKMLMKKVITKKVPVYEWVVEDLCGACDARVEAPTVAANAVIPPPPTVNAVFHYGKMAPKTVRLQLTDETPKDRKVLDKPVVAACFAREAR